ncbi:MAG: HAD-superfamily hydrolase, subfamily variant 3 [Deltaproteobacteria bacterium]|nr:HAD-superfamily hydrolase, subfamily variant 3 [Deltaproteobacteria bacterium]
MRVHSLPLPEAVIFDFDGIIVDTEPLHYKAFLSVLEPLGLGFAWEEYVATYMGFDDRDAFREAYRARGRDLDGKSLKSLVAAKSRAFLDILRAGVEPYPGAVPMIESLHVAGVPLAISSGALLSDVAPILGGLGIDRCFPVVVTADDVRKSKPDPECYALAFRRLSRMRPARVTVPERSFAIEDTPAGIRSAKGAGLRVLAVTNSYGAGELAEADWVADSLENVRIA